jgi:hypothetical protein
VSLHTISIHASSPRGKISQEFSRDPHGTQLFPAAEIYFQIIGGWLRPVLKLGGFWCVCVLSDAEPYTKSGLGELTGLALAV